MVCNARKNKRKVAKFVLEHQTSCYAYNISLSTSDQNGTLINIRRWFSKVTKNMHLEYVYVSKAVYGCSKPPEIQRHSNK